MSFQLTCPNCGKRYVSEFAFRGTYKARPTQAAEFADWTDYVYMHDNHKGMQVEWWYHRAGCKRWFLVKRDTTENTCHTSFWFEDRHLHLGKPAQDQTPPHDSTPEKKMTDIDNNDTEEATNGQSNPHPIPSTLSAAGTTSTS